MADDDESGPVVFEASEQTTTLQEQPPIPADLGSLPHTRSNLDLIKECDNFPYYQTDPQRYLALTQEYFAFLLLGHDSVLGYVLPNVAAVLDGIPGWTLNKDDRTLTLAAGNDRAERSAHIAQTCLAMRETGHFEVLKGWRNELYPVYSSSGQILLEMERAASALFGIVTYGCHMTAYVRVKSSNEMKIWVPRRARTKQTYGGMLDNTVAGGIAVGETPYSSMLREAGEEASLEEALVQKNMKAAGAVCYFHIRDERAGGETNLLQPECQYVYDLELDEETVPKPSDDEVEDFTLMSIDEVKNALAAGEFKPNCALVLVDFFIRHGFITPENEKNYLEINARMNRLLEFPVAIF